MGSSGFVPEVIIVHVPSYAYTFIQELTDYFGEKIPVFGILHKTDIEVLTGNEALKSSLETRFSAIYARSPGIRRKAEECGLRNLRSETIYSGIPLEAAGSGCSPCTIVEMLRVVYAGKLIPLKHVDAVIRALSRLEIADFRFDIIGEGAEEQRLRMLTKELGLEEKVFFLGRMERSDVISHMKKANLYCMPSFPETLGLTYLEAMSVGCIPIGTKGEGIDGIIQDGWNGYLVDAANLQDSIIAKIQTYILLDDEERRLLSERARESIQAMDEPSCAERFLGIIHNEMLKNEL